MSRRTLRLPGDARAAAAARRALEPAIKTLPERRRADVRLLATELVSNAFRHGAPPISLTVEIARTHLRIEVADSGGGRPQRSPNPGADGGWGLLLVEAASDRWGVADGSTSVWFEVDR
jgi:anti-sigma regulatory factor (Ser/Thr protein kinase)